MPSAGGLTPSPGSEMNILVRNLIDLVTGEKLASIFRRFGKVSSVRIVRDKKTGQYIGIGFVEMPDQAEGTAAIKALHHTELFKETIRVKEAKPKFGPAYFAENPEMIVEIFRPGSVTPEVKFVVDGAFGKMPGARKNGSARPPRAPVSSFARQNYRGEKTSPRMISAKSNHRGRRPYTSHPPREGADYKPHGERSFSPRSSGERGNRPYTSHSPRTGADYKPHGERKFIPRGTGVPPVSFKTPVSSFAVQNYRGEKTSPRMISAKSNHRGSRPYQGRKPFAPEYKPRREHPYVPRHGGQAREGRRPDFKPRAEHPYVPKGQGVNSNQPFARYRGVKGSSPAKRFRGKRDFSPHK